MKLMTSNKNVESLRELSELSGQRKKLHKRDVFLSKVFIFKRL